jgi:TPR repeat protein
MMSQIDLLERLPQPRSRPSGEQLFKRGMGYATGLGAPVDLISAHALFDIAARLGSVEAKIYRRTIGGDMEPTQIAEALRVARDWLARGLSEAGSQGAVATQIESV